MIPLSAVWDILEDNINRDNWNEAWGFYSLGARRSDEPLCFVWQLGWAGGCQNTHAFLFCGKDLMRRRARRNLETILTRSQAPSGFFYGMGDGQRWYGDGFSQRFPNRLSLVRKNADALYFFLNQFLLLKRQGEQVPVRWEDAVRRQADAFVTLWKRRGQFGQFINVESGDMVIGATTSAAIAPAALALASRYYGRADYLQRRGGVGTPVLQSGRESRGHHRRSFRALQAPDYESAYHLLESFTVLYEITRKDAWLTAAEEQARQFATWIVSYDYEFPPDSTFGKLGMRTTGTCWANAQNKCASPVSAPLPATLY